MRVAFEGTSLNVYDYQGTHVVNQPFKPTATGEKLEWQSEEEAVAWAQENLNLNQWAAPVETPADDTAIGE
jgi:hypothetical protein